MAKKRIAILYGGRSAEHEVSLSSAKTISSYISRSLYDVILIWVSFHGDWFWNELEQFGAELDLSTQVALVPSGQTGMLFNLNNMKELTSIDVLFPMIQGTFGEDGSVQGLARLANTPCVGSSVLGSAVGMDKDVTKRLLKASGIKCADNICIHLAMRGKDTDYLVDKELGFPVFVKPANLGSSIGVSKVSCKNELQPAIDKAFQYDSKILVEKMVRGREIECSLLGNDEPLVSIVGEVVNNEGFYTYENKYADSSRSSFLIPAPLDEGIYVKAQQTAKQVFKVLEAKGLARVDMFLTDDGDIYVNEINTIPAFTERSLYHKLWESSGLCTSELIDKLIDLALEEYHFRQCFKYARC